MYSYITDLIAKRDGDLAFLSFFFNFQTLLHFLTSLCMPHKHSSPMVGVYIAHNITI